uniref:ADF-H domain-containing protein n=1 Tax=Cercocebus atys TaxID=9531 RepID=A0A2K5MNA6_CERAT
TVNDEFIKGNLLHKREIKRERKQFSSCLSDDKRQIIVEKQRPLHIFVKLLPLNDWRYALYDTLVFIFWYDLSRPLKIAIKKKFTEFFLFSIKHEWQVNGLDDIKDRSTLGEKLGGNVVVSLEGKPL